jgi:hypothetical protein
MAETRPHRPRLVTGRIMAWTLLILGLIAFALALAVPGTTRDVASAAWVALIAGTLIVAALLALALLRSVERQVQR